MQFYFNSFTSLPYSSNTPGDRLFNHQNGLVRPACLLFAYFIKMECERPTLAAPGLFTLDHFQALEAKIGKFLLQPSTSYFYLPRDLLFSFLQFLQHEETACLEEVRSSGPGKTLADNSIIATHTQSSTIKGFSSAGETLSTLTLSLC